MFVTIVGVSFGLFIVYVFCATTLEPRVLDFCKGANGRKNKTKSVRRMDC